MILSANTRPSPLCVAFITCEYEPSPIVLEQSKSSIVTLGPRDFDRALVGVLDRGGMLLFSARPASRAKYDGGREVRGERELGLLVRGAENVRIGRGRCGGCRCKAVAPESELDVEMTDALRLNSASEGIGASACAVAAFAFNMQKVAVGESGWLPNAVNTQSPRVSNRKSHKPSNRRSSYIFANQ